MIIWFALFLFFVLWLMGKRIPAIFILFCIACGFFGLEGFPSSKESSEYHNSLFLAGNIFLLIEFTKYGLDRVIKDKVALFILLSYIFFMAHCFLTIIFNIDTPHYAFAVLRILVYPFLAYFILMKLNHDEAVKRDMGTGSCFRIFEG